MPKSIFFYDMARVRILEFQNLHKHVKQKIPCQMDDQLTSINNDDVNDSYTTKNCSGFRH